MNRFRRAFDVIRDSIREAIALESDLSQLDALCRRVPEVRALRDRIDAPDFATPQELAYARDCIAHRVGEPQGRLTL